MLTRHKLTFVEHLFKVQECQILHIFCCKCINKFVNYKVNMELQILALLKKFWT